MMNTRKLVVQIIGLVVMIAVLVACGAAQSVSTPTNTSQPSTATSETIVQYPSKRDFHSMAYDTESDKAILFGGFVSRDVANLKDTWAYDYVTNTWTEMTPSNGPVNREASAMVYNSKADRIILFGGYNSTNTMALDDTWAYDYNTNTWTEMSPPGSPQKDGHAMAYDSESDKIILFGGGIDTIGGDETWTYDYNANTWTKMSPENSPPKEYFHQMAYDSKSDRVILWGTLAVFNEDYSVWAYDYNTDTWEEIKPNNGHPKLFKEGAMAYDSSAERIILHHSVDLWTYDYKANAWTELKPDKPVPYLLYRHAMVYNTKADRIIAFGGEMSLGDEPVGQTWVFDLNTVTWTDMTPSGE